MRLMSTPPVHITLILPQFLLPLLPPSLACLACSLCFPLLAPCLLLRNACSCALSAPAQCLFLFLPPSPHSIPLFLFASPLHLPLLPSTFHFHFPLPLPPLSPSPCLDSDLLVTATTPYRQQPRPHCAFGLLGLTALAFLALESPPSTGVGMLSVHRGFQCTRSKGVRMLSFQRSSKGAPRGWHVFRPRAPTGWHVFRPHPPTGSNIFKCAHSSPLRASPFQPPCTQGGSHVSAPRPSFFFLLHFNPSNSINPDFQIKKSKTPSHSSTHPSPPPISPPNHPPKPPPPNPDPTSPPTRFELAPSTHPPSIHPSNPPSPSPPPRPHPTTPLLLFLLPTPTSPLHSQPHHPHPPPRPATPTLLRPSTRTSSRTTALLKPDLKPGFRPVIPTNINLPLLLF